MAKLRKKLCMPSSIVAQRKNSLLLWQGKRELIMLLLFYRASHYKYNMYSRMNATVLKDIRAYKVAYNDYTILHICYKMLNMNPA